MQRFTPHHPGRCFRDRQKCLCFRHLWRRANAGFNEQIIEAVQWRVAMPEAMGFRPGQRQHRPAPESQDQDAANSLPAHDRHRGYGAISAKGKQQGLTHAACSTRGCNRSSSCSISARSKRIATIPAPSCRSAFSPRQNKIANARQYSFRTRRPSATRVHQRCSARYRSMPENHIRCYASLAGNVQCRRRADGWICNRRYKNGRHAGTSNQSCRSSGHSGASAMESLPAVANAI